MGQHKGAILSQYKIAGLVAGFILIFTSAPLLAQTGCVGDPCVYEMTLPAPSITPTPTATPGPGTPTAMATANLPWTVYGIPTSIPTTNFSISTTPTPFIMPTVSFSSATAIPLSEISTTLAITHSAVQNISASGTITDTTGYTFSVGLLSDGYGIISDVVSYTTYISGVVASLDYTETLTITTAPAWYAPLLPRQMASVGWTIENITTSAAHNYSLSTWTYLFGYMAALPFRMIRALWAFLAFLGPFGLFLIWLMIVMLPAVLGFKILLFVKESIIRSFNFVMSIISFLLDLVKIFLR